MIEFSADQTIEQVLLGGYYQIPRFQRPYSWTADNIGDFWTDVAQSEAADYFIGAVIVYSSEPAEGGRRSTEYFVVDGQQRLTTIMVLLASLRDSFEEVGESELARGVQGYIQRPDRRHRPRFVLETEAGFPYLHAVIQSFPQEERPPGPLRADEKLLAQAHDYFRDELRKLRTSVLSDTTIPGVDRGAEFVRRLEELRDRILSLTVILVVVGDVDDAYVIFETLNTRGKDLSLADLVRNFLLRDLRESADAADMPRERFNRLLEALQEPGVDINPSDFLHHSWLSRRDYSSRKNLFAEIKGKVRTKDQKAAYLRELEQDLPVYIKARRPAAGRWQREQAQVARSLRALDVFHMTQPAPLVLAALRAYEVERTLSLRQLKRLLALIEAFHFKFTAVAGKSSSGGISFRYASHARRFLGSSADDHQRNIDELAGKLRDAAPSRDEFLAGFAGLGYASNATSQKSLVKYILDEIYRHHTPGAVEVDFSAMTIEHLAPERPRAEGDAGVSQESVASIGNLILVSQSLNNQLANRSFSEKRAILATQTDLWVDPLILNADSWGVAEISSRASALGAAAFDVIWQV